MPLPDQRHTVRLPLPDMIVRSRATTVAALVYLDGAEVTPASWALTVYDATNTSAYTASGSSSAASKSIPANTFSTYSYGEGWRVEWAITLSGGAVMDVRNDAMLVRTLLYPVVSDDDLVRRVPSLGGSHPITTSADYQDYLDEAWTEIQLRLISLGSRPYLVMEPSALRNVHLYSALALIFEDLRARNADSWEDRAGQYRQLAEQAWGMLSPRYDRDDDGVADTRRQSATASIWLSGGRGNPWPQRSGSGE